MKAFSRRDADTICEIVSDVARTEIMPRFAGGLANAAREKTSAFDIVTEADEAAERAIAERLRAAYPTAAIVGEEATAKDPSLMAHIATAELAFIIDPIDGTKNFVAGIPLFGVMVAATFRGEIVFGAIHDPVCQDTAVAIRGNGAWRQGGVRPETVLRVAQTVPVDQMQGVAGTAFLPETLSSSVARNLSKFSMTFWMRCAAHEYRMAAAGHCHFLMFNRLMPWDHAAGWLIHREAGGHSAHFDGSPYQPNHTTGGLIYASDVESWGRVREALLELPPDALANV